LEADLRTRLDARQDEDTLVLVDAFGATPCNVAQRVADGVRVRVVAGVNVPMLWRTLCYRHETLEALVDRAVAGATQGVMHVAVTRRQNQSPGAGAHDQVQHSHHQ
jgi:PTS system ascorbate-specific IIA component